MTEKNDNAQRALINLHSKAIHQNNISWPAVVFVDEETARSWQGTRRIEIVDEFEVEMARLVWEGREDQHGNAPSEERQFAFIVSWSH